MLSRVHVTLDSSAWVLIEVDPDVDGYTKILIDQLVGNKSDTEWSTINTIVDRTSSLSKEMSTFEYNVYIRNISATVANPIDISITRI